MPLFNNLPIGGGVGDYHINQFRIHFRARGASSAEDTLPRLKTLLYDNFAGPGGYFSHGNYATLQHGESWFSDGPTFRFNLDARVRGWLTTVLPYRNLPDFHSDWVFRVQNHRTGFAFQTLKRNFYEGPETILALERSPVVDSLIRINQHHFLAGRRSWLFFVDDSTLPGTLTQRGAGAQVRSNQISTLQSTTTYILETAAIERYSLLEYQSVARDPGLVQNMRAVVGGIWTRMLLNFTEISGYTTISVAPGTYQDEGGTRWISFGQVYGREIAVESNPLNLQRTHPWIGQILLMHPALLDQLHH